MCGGFKCVWGGGVKVWVRGASVCFYVPCMDVMYVCYVMDVMYGCHVCMLDRCSRMSNTVCAAIPRTSVFFITPCDSVVWICVGDVWDWCVWWLLMYRRIV